MPPRKFKSRATQKGDLGITAREVQKINWDAKRPLSPFHYMQNGYSIEDCDQEHKAFVIDALWKRSRLTWGQIRQTDRHGLGHEIISRSSITVHIPQEISEDVKFITFHSHGLKPMIGFRRDNVFHLVWIDCDFSVYQH